MYHRDPSKLQRDLSPEFGGTAGQIWGASYYMQTICHVCRLQLYPEKDVPNFFPAAQFIDQVQFTTPGGLSLCKRHFDLVDGLIKRKIDVDQWPSQLIRGIVTFSKAYLQAGMDGVSAAQKGLGSIQTTKTVITPAPIVGNTYNPVSTFGGTGTFSYDFLVFPMQRQVVDQQAVNELNWTQNYLKFSQQRIQTFTEQVSKYSELLEKVRKDNPAKFVTCLRCGQSEMPLGTKVCTWCGQSQGYTGEAVPTPCLVEDVDPLNVVPLYSNRTGTAVLNNASGNIDSRSYSGKSKYGKNENQRNDVVSPHGIATDVFCTTCGSKILNPKSNFCDSCGSSIDRKKQPISSNRNNNKAKSGEPFHPQSSVKRPLDQPFKEKKVNFSGSGDTKEEEIPETSHYNSNTDNSTADSSKGESLKFCPECGRKLPFDGTKYCPYCGEKMPDPSKTKTM